MTETVNTPGLPAPYRLMLALSSAVAIHLVGLSLWSYTLPTPPPESRLTVALVAPSSAASRPTPSRTPEARPERADNSSEPDRSEPRQAPEQVYVRTPNAAGASNRSPANMASPPQPATPSTTQAPPVPDTRRTPKAADTNSVVQPAQAAPAPASESTASPSTPATTVAAATDDLTRITHAPAEKDDYLVTLAGHLARQLKSLHTPVVEDLKTPRKMTVVLRLMENGTLTQASVSQSTGLAALDRAVYRAALAASPYPEPPAGRKSEGRFEIDLVFSPKRL